MSIQTIKTLDGHEFVLLPIECYERLKTQIDEYLYNQESSKETYLPFKLENYVRNPAALARINAGVTQKELSELLNVSQAYISKIEGNEHVSAKTMLKIQQALDNLRAKR